MPPPVVRPPAWPEPAGPRVTNGIALSALGTAFLVGGLVGSVVLLDLALALVTTGTGVALGAFGLHLARYPRPPVAPEVLVPAELGGESDRWALRFGYHRASEEVVGFGVVILASGTAFLLGGLINLGLDAFRYTLAALWFVLSIPALAVALANIRGAVARRDHRRLTIVVDAEGVTFRCADAARLVPWSRIRRIRAERHVFTGPQYNRTLQIDLVDEGSWAVTESMATDLGIGAARERLAVPMAYLRQDPAVLFAVLDHYQRHPDDRENLPEHHWPTRST